MQLEEKKHSTFKTKGFSFTSARLQRHSNKMIVHFFWHRKNKSNDNAKAVNLCSSPYV